MVQLEKGLGLGGPGAKGGQMGHPDGQEDLPDRQDLPKTARRTWPLGLSRKEDGNPMLRDPN